MSGIKMYANKVPEEIRTYLKALGNDTNLGLLMYLLSEGESNLSKMSKDLSTSEKYLIKKLVPLTQKALVNCHPTREGPTCKVGILGKQMIFGLMYTSSLTEKEMDNVMAESGRLYGEAEVRKIKEICGDYVEWIENYSHGLIIKSLRSGAAEPILIEMEKYPEIFGEEIEGLKKVIEG